MEFLELVWASFVSIIAPILGTMAGVIGLVLLTKLMKSLGLKVDQQQMNALSAAADAATKSVEAWAAKKAAESGAKPSSKEKAERAVNVVKSFLDKQGLYAIADEKIAAAIEAKLGENAIELDDIATLIRTRKKASVGN